MSIEFAILIFGFIGGFYMAWNIGANDVANSMASAVGAKAITIRQAVIIAAVLNIVGAVFLGGSVTDTIRNGIVSPEIIAEPRYALIGALSALVAAAAWLSFATWKALPVSTTHSIVGAMIGFGLMAGGLSSINWNSLLPVVASWIVSPLFSLIIAYALFMFIKIFILTRENPFRQAMRLAPVFVFITIFIVCLSFLFKTPLGTKLAFSTWQSLLLGLSISAVFTVLAQVGFIHMFKNKYKDDKNVEHIFKNIQIGTACYVALAQGANDVANAIGPLVLIYFVVKTGTVGANLPVPIFLLIFGGAGIALGIWMAGHRVIATIGTNITTLNNTRGFAVVFSSATTVLLASKLGLPVSTTHASVGSVIGVGLSGGIAAVNFSVVFKIMIYWVLTVPAAAITSMIFYKIIMFILSFF